MLGAYDKKERRHPHSFSPFLLLLFWYNSCLCLHVGLSDTASPVLASCILILPPLHWLRPGERLAPVPLTVHDHLVLVGCPCPAPSLCISTSGRGEAHLERPVVCGVLPQVLVLGGLCPRLDLTQNLLLGRPAGHPMLLQTTCSCLGTITRESDGI